MRILYHPTFCLAQHGRMYGYVCASSPFHRWPRSKQMQTKAKEDIESRFLLLLGRLITRRRRRLSGRNFALATNAVRATKGSTMKMDVSTVSKRARSFFMRHPSARTITYLHLHSEHAPSLTRIHILNLHLPLHAPVPSSPSF